MGYRVHRYNTNIVTKIIHILFHFAAIGLGLPAMVSVVLSIQFAKTSHFSNIHSGLGVVVLIVYTGQLSFGTFLFPRVPESFRARLMSVHRAVGISCMIISCVQYCLGYQQMIHNKLECFKDLSCKNRTEYIGAIAMLFTILYTLLILAVVTPKPWRREKTVDELK